MSWRPAIALAGVLSLLALGRPAGAHALHDRGIFSDLDAAVAVSLPDGLDGARLRLVVDRPRRVVLLLDGDRPLNAYALTRRPPDGRLETLLGALPDEDARGLRARGASQVLDRRDPTAPRLADSDGDGIPDRLDVLLGARKLAANAAVYTEGYRVLPYPGGDVPRETGVCTDTIVRAFRNAGLDLQQLVAEDIRRAPAAYPMVRRPDPSIDHRRVKTLIRWFERHVPLVPPGDPMQPGDVVFFDTFPSRPGPDHVGIVSDRPGRSGLPLVINNWTVGSREGEMDLLPSVPVTHRFRLP